MTKQEKSQDRIDLARARAIIDAFGADAARWPVTERRALEDMVASTPALNQYLVEAALLDRLLAEEMAPTSLHHGALKGRILAAIEGQQESFGARLARALGFQGARAPGAVFQPLGILMAAAVLGIAVGGTLVEPSAAKGAVTSEAINTTLVAMGDTIVEDSQ
jgi:hypothetical protein